MICALAHPPAAIDVTVNALSIADALKQKYSVSLSRGETKPIVGEGRLSVGMGSILILLTAPLSSTKDGG